MKKTVLVIMIVILGAVSSFAKPPKDLPLNKKLRTAIEKLLSQPDFSVDQIEMSAVVEFILNENGEIVVLTVKSKEAILEHFIKTRLNYQSILPSQTVLTRNRFVIPVKLIKRA